MSAVFWLRLGIGALTLSVSTVGSAGAGAPSSAEAVHVLNRLSYGPAPGDIDRVLHMGIDSYIDEQLHPEHLPEPEQLQQRLADLEIRTLSQQELVAQYRQAAQTARNDDAGKSMRREFYLRMSLESGEERLLRAIQSPHQLQEVMVDFWFNHFNVFSGKGLDRVLVENYEREAIRPHALGRFRDLLGATAHHPAMLFYLDNWLSAAPGYQPRHRAASPAAESTGLNENYARELMELHTLGVDGGYTQNDVTALARILTGWTLNPRAQTGDSIFRFDARRHDYSDKKWLGRHVAGRGQAEGEWVLDVLASHPATAHHIALELAQYFVSDSPPAALVDRLTRRFIDTDGDIAAVLKTLFNSSEFRDPAFHGTKFKTPYQYVISMVRASHVTVTNVRPLLTALSQLGMPLYGCQTPDGYKNTESAWLSPDAMTRRISIATAFATGTWALTRPPHANSSSGSMNLMMQRHPANMDIEAREEQARNRAPIDATVLLSSLGESISAKTAATITQSEPALRAALVLGSPDFMRH